MKRTSWLYLPARAAERAEAALRTRFLFEAHVRRVRAPRQVGFTRRAVGAADLRAAGFAVRELRVEPAELRRYVRAAGYWRHPLYLLGLGGPRSGRFLEKALEHHLAAQLLDLHPGDVYVDVASGGSPAAPIYARLYGCRALRQDRDFPAGVRGDLVGGTAGRLPLPDGFASKLALHCSFEHLEGDEDMRFLREAARVLRPGGRLCILPLYLHSEHAILADPVLLRDGGRGFDAGARVCCARGWGNRHGRHYDVRALGRRVRDQLGPLRLELVAIGGAAAIHPACYVDYAAVMTR